MATDIQAVIIVFLVVITSGCVGQTSELGDLGRGPENDIYGIDINFTGPQRIEVNESAHLKIRVRTEKPKSLENVSLRVYEPPSLCMPKKTYEVGNLGPNETVERKVKIYGQGEAAPNVEVKVTGLYERNLSKIDVSERAIHEVKVGSISTSGTASETLGPLANCNKIVK